MKPISRAIAIAFGRTWSFGTIWLKSPEFLSSFAWKTRPVKHNSNAKKEEDEERGNLFLMILFWSW